jgi:H+-transporting ATPase
VSSEAYLSDTTSRAPPSTAGKWEKIDAGALVPGDCVLLASGSAVPADCIVNHNQIDVDQSALTGESLPVTLFEGESAKMGSTVTRGEVEGTVEVRGRPAPGAAGCHWCRAAPALRCPPDLALRQCSPLPLPPLPAQFTGKNTFFGKTASLLQGVDELGNIQKILLQLMIVLVRRRLLAAASLPALACLQPALGTSTTTQHARPARLP